MSGQSWRAETKLAAPVTVRLAQQNLQKTTFANQSIQKYKMASKRYKITTKWANNHKKRLKDHKDTEKDTKYLQRSTKMTTKENNTKSNHKYTQTAFLQKTTKMRHHINTTEIYDTQREAKQQPKTEALQRLSLAPKNKNEVPNVSQSIHGKK